MIASAATLRKLQPVTPFVERSKVGGMSFGLSHAGYDVRIGEIGCRFWQSLPEGYSYFLKPGEFVLASTMEEFHMPPHLVGIVHDKSTWARRGLAVQNTVIEPGWKGFLTLELTNHSDDTLAICQGWPIAQIIFHYTDQPCKPYSGKYQNQNAGPQPAILEDH